MSLFAPQLDTALPAALTGTVAQTVGLTVAVAGMPAPVGALVQIARQGADALDAEVIGFRDAHTLVMPLGELEGVRLEAPVRLVRTSRSVKVCPALVGRVIDARGG